MNTLLALTLIASAYGFIATIFLFSETAKRKQAESQLSASKCLRKHLEADRDQLAQALKETQDKLDSVKVRRDAKTGRMVSAKRK